jgi:Na+/H+ antiporter NhaC
MLFIIFITMILTIALLAVLERERQRRAKHRAQTRHLLLYIKLQPHIQTLAAYAPACATRR